MAAKLLNRFLGTIANAWLMVQVHLYAAWVEPRAYATAAMWWILRKRVRARGQMAPLLGRSPKAYMVWGLREERNASPSPANQAPPIIALVQTGTNADWLDSTLASLAAESLPVFLIGPDQNSDLTAAAAAIDWSAEPWLLPVAAGDRLAPGAAAAYRAAMSDPAIHVIFADDEAFDRFDRRTAPHFKPDWNSELFQHFDYLTGSCIIKADQSALAAAASHPGWAAALVAAGVAHGGAAHLRRMLHQRRHRPQPPAAAQPVAAAANLPPLSIIIPTRNRVDLLRTCLDGVAKTDYPDLEVIVMDNDSDDPATLAYLAAQDPARVRVLRHPGAFNYSTINNRAAAEARGRLLCLLNNDIEVMSPDWLKIMATQALRDNVGAVGAQLLYPDGRIQHAGVVIGVGNAAGHAHRFLRPQAEGYFRRHALPQFVAAVTAACLVVDRDRFLAVGGLDERNFAVAFNDVDLCLRLNERGWQSLYEPRAVLIHHESVSRGHDKDPVGAARFARELAALKKIWKTDQIVDRFHHPHLSRAAEQFTVAI